MSLADSRHARFGFMAELLGVNPQEQMMESLKFFQEQQQLMNNNTKTSQLNLKTGQEFLANNKKNKNIKVLKNGLQYQIMKSGEKLAKSPTINDKVQVQKKQVAGGLIIFFGLWLMIILIQIIRGM